MLFQLLSSKQREVRLQVTNASRMCVETMSPQTTPDVPLRYAVRMALAYPGKKREFITILPEAVSQCALV